MKYLFVVIGIALLAGVGFFVTRQSQDDSAEQEALPVEQGMPAIEGTEEMVVENDTSMLADDEEAMEEYDYVIDMDNYSFQPSVIEAEPGQTLMIKVKTVEGMHDFVVDDLNVASTVLQVGDEEVVEINIPEDADGEYEFYCSVGNHRQLGMVGTLKIIE